MKMPDPETEPKLFAQWALSCLVRWHGEPRAREILRAVAASPDEKKMWRDFTLALYDAEPNANNAARYLAAIKLRPTLEAAERYVDRALSYRRRRRRGMTKK